ncbi:hypothetical protein L1N85_25155 [Paenibacillus alkaliterrae]|uniref:FGGY family carbohydrate kinase n=1 Tax=Paenibacillus alkaliterrae TaxID=320909 RepID=UPI001EFF282A|nr:FGGY family carbohydrate kinase [Paenibacillus alkaliterrae]MCF2941628.1 hypothetical protein [Paenibacillus alkaliterrae]
MSYLMGIDLGTSSVKTMIMDENGTVKSLSSEPYPIEIPLEGHAEQNPHTWWKATVITIRDSIRRSGVLPSEIKGIGLSGQMHGLVMLD